MIKRGQVTIFIIVGIIIASVILIYLIVARPEFTGSQKGRPGFEGCVEDSLEVAINELSLNGGYINQDFFYLYLGQEIPYLCYTNEFYDTCVVQEPFLKQHFEKNIKSRISKNVEECYKNSIDELRSRGLEVSEGSVDFDVAIRPSEVNVTINAPTNIGTSSFKKFNAKVNSPIYDMLMISTSVLQYETKLGDSDISSLMAVYPDYIINKLKQGDGTKIYVIESKVYETKFQFASRSLAWPAGYDI